MKGRRAVELVRREFLIQAEDGSGQVVVRDPTGTILATGDSTAEAIGRLQALICGAMGAMIPWSAVVRFRPDGRIGLTGVYRVMKAERRGAVRSRQRPA
jgi:hypothetical protein